MPKGFIIRDIDKGMRSIVRELTKAAKPHVKVGILSDAGQYAQQTEVKRVKLSKAEQKEGGPTHKYKKGRTKGSNANLADVATWMEFGTHSIPERPFMRQAFDANHDSISSFIRGQYAQVVDGKKSVEMGLKSIGVFFEGVVKRTIVSGKFKALTQRTIKRKGSSKPLIDTGRLRQSITHEVVLNPTAAGGGR